MDAERGGLSGPGGLEEPPPEDEGEYWEDDELTAEELTRWQDLMCAAERGAAPGDPGAEDPGAGEGNVPDLIGAVLVAAGDPALMSDAELLESLARWHAVAARAAGRELRATEELLRRRRPRVWDRRADRKEERREELDGASLGQDQGPERVMPAVVVSREAAAEIALVLTATEYSAQAQVELTADLSRRLPAAFGELDAGRADLSRVRVLAEGTQFLTDEAAGQVDTLLAPRLGRVTTGELRDRVRRTVIKIDPAAAQRRADHAARKARFALYANPDQTATATVERMPAHLGAAVKARVNAIARAARAAGMAGSLGLLEAKVATGLLLDTLPHIPPPADGNPDDGGSPIDPGPAGPWDDGWPADWFTGPAAPGGHDEPGQQDLASAPGTEPADFGPDEPDAVPAQPPAADDPIRSQGRPAGTGEAMAWPQIPVQAGSGAPGCRGLPAWLVPGAAGRIRLTAAWRTLNGTGPEPGDLSWIGPVIPAQARDLAAAAAADPGCAWRLIITDDQGRAIATTTLRARRARRARRAVTARSPGLVSEVTITIAQSMAAALARSGPNLANLANLARHGQLASVLAAAIPAANRAAAEAAAAAAADAAVGGCAHAMAVPGYRVPDRLRRWLTTRDRTCRHPGCRTPATRCDLDHTLAYDRGGRTCPCGLGALCRVHHQLKQLPGWQLTQDSQGCFTWRTPAGLTYRKEPHRYPV